ncbi:MAG: hypothetical protein EOO05_04985 [Chitinophagaceae bacterium]|nr:MAG: hypothetical protein EOO05_04985 [Chitinophagaceae bacterium]
MKNSKFLSAIAIAFLLLVQVACNSQKLTGVYCGVELTISPMMGGGMDRNDITLYLRPDGTFADEMDKPDWKTRVDGSYTVQGNKMSLNYAEKERQRTLTINSNGTLKLSTGYLLRKMDTRPIPAGTYKFEYASGSGGGISGVPYIGSSGGTNIYFDGKGTFNQDGYGSVMISGDNIGGGSSRKNNAAGTYVQKDGILTLTYVDGKKEQSSFFVGDDLDGTMVVMNGEIFFRESEKDITTRGTGEGANSNSGKKEASGTVKPTSQYTAAQLVEKIRAKHGGEAIDRINNYKISGNMNGFGIVSLTDLQKGWVRTELLQNGKVIAVEQLENDKGWTWAKGKKQPLTAARVKEMKAGLQTGFNVLKSVNLSKLTSGQVSAADGNYILTYTVDGTEFAMMVDPQFRVISEGRKVNGQMQVNRMSDFRTVGGILVPFTEKMTDGKTEMKVAINDFSVNGVAEADWKEPS